MIEELTTAQIAVRVGVSERTIQRWLKEHRLQATKLAYNRYAVESTDLERMRLAEHINEETRIQALERRVTELSERHEATSIAVQVQLGTGQAALDILGQQFRRLIEMVDSARSEREQLQARIEEMTAHVSEIEAQLHEMRVVFLSDIWRTAPEALLSVQARMQAVEQRLSDIATTPTTSATPSKKHVLPTKRETTLPSPAPTLASAEGLVAAVPFAERHGVKEAAKTAFKRQTIKTTQPVKPGSHYLDAQQQRLAVQYWQFYHTPGYHPCDDPECPCHDTDITGKEG